MLNKHGTQIFMIFMIIKDAVFVGYPDLHRGRLQIFQESYDHLRCI